MSVIQMRQVGKRYATGVEVLKDVSLEVAQGSFVVILGPSGAGKSTLLRLMNGLETTTSGEIHVAGQPLSARTLRKVRRHVAMVFQHFNLVSRLSVMTNILTGRLAHRATLPTLFYLFHKNDYEIARHALARVGLSDKAWNRADKLSGGQQQRVGIARALAQQPNIILADEPVASLDPVTSEEVMGLLKEICARDGITIVANLHQVSLAKRYADRIIGLNAGRIVFDGAPGEFDQQAMQKVYQREGEQHDEAVELALAYA